VNVNDFSETCSQVPRQSEGEAFFAWPSIFPGRDIGRGGDIVDVKVKCASSNRNSNISFFNA
jgi:hypothetical protein